MRIKGRELSSKNQARYSLEEQDKINDLVAAITPLLGGSTDWGKDVGDGYHDWDNYVYYITADGMIHKRADFIQDDYDALGIDLDVTGLSDTDKALGKLTSDERSKDVLYLRKALNALSLVSMWNDVNSDTIYFCVPYAQTGRAGGMTDAQKRTISWLLEGGKDDTLGNDGLFLGDAIMKGSWGMDAANYSSVGGGKLIIPWTNKGNAGAVYGAKDHFSSEVTKSGLMRVADYIQRGLSRYLEKDEFSRADYHAQKERFANASQAAKLRQARKLRQSMRVYQSKSFLVGNTDFLGNANINRMSVQNISDYEYRLLQQDVARLNALSSSTGREPNSAYLDNWQFSGTLLDIPFGYKVPKATYKDALKMLMRQVERFVRANADRDDKYARGTRRKRAGERIDQTKEEVDSDTTTDDEYVSRYEEKHKATTADTEKKLVIMMGLPASGKSHQSNKDYAGMFVVDSDDIKKIMFGHEDKSPEWTHERSKRIEKSLYRRAIERGESLVWDTTGTNINAVKAIVDYAHENGYTTYLLYIKADKAIVKVMNRNRDRTVPEHIIDEKAVEIDPAYNELKSYVDVALPIRDVTDELKEVIKTKGWK